MTGKKEKDWEPRPAIYPAEWITEDDNSSSQTRQDEGQDPIQPDEPSDLEPHR